MDYRRRLVDDLLDRLFPQLAAVALEGAKGVGKTATASQRAKTILTLSEPRQREVLTADLDHITRVTPPVFIDEWQLEPAVWDRVRSGFPGIRSLPEGARNIQLDSYTTRIVERELLENGVAVRPNAPKAWLTAYGAATSTDAAYTTILDAATAGERDKPARQTVDIYRKHLQRIGAPPGTAPTLATALSTAVRTRYIQ